MKRKCFVCEEVDDIGFFLSFIRCNSILDLFVSHTCKECRTALDALGLISKASDDEFDRDIRIKTWINHRDNILKQLKRIKPCVRIDMV